MSLIWSFPNCSVAVSSVPNIRGVPCARTWICRRRATSFSDRNIRNGRRGQAPNHSGAHSRSEEHTSELQSLMRISYAVFCLKKKKKKNKANYINSRRTIKRETHRDEE